MKYVILCDANVEEGRNDSFCQVIIFIVERVLVGY